MCISGKEDQWLLLFHGCLRSTKAVNNAEVSNENITQDTTYNGLAATLEDFYDAGYRFCSITELMEYKGIERSDISGKLNNVDGNKGMVTNIANAATYGKAE